jgi:hypothetical protein
MKFFLVFYLTFLIGLQESISQEQYNFYIPDYDNRNALTYDMKRVEDVIYITGIFADEQGHHSMVTKFYNQYEYETFILENISFSISPIVENEGDLYYLLWIENNL